MWTLPAALGVLVVCALAQDKPDCTVQKDDAGQEFGACSLDTSPSGERYDAVRLPTDPVRLLSASGVDFTAFSTAPLAAPGPILTSTTCVETCFAYIRWIRYGRSWIRVVPNYWVNWCYCANAQCKGQVNQIMWWTGRCTQQWHWKRIFVFFGGKYQLIWYKTNSGCCCVPTPFTAPGRK